MEHTAQVMGIAGAGRGTGVTHFVIQAANYLCSCRQKKTAILQWNPQKDLEKIRAFLGAGGKEDSRSFKKKDHFRLLGVDYYYEGMDLYDCIWQRDHETGDRAAVSHFLKTDPTFSRCLFSRHSDHGMVCGYI